MINIKELKEKKLWYLKKFKEKGYELRKEIEEIIKLYEEYLKHLKAEQEVRMRINQVSKIIEKNLHDQTLKQEAQKLAKAKKELHILTKKTLSRIEAILPHFPNPAAKEVKIGSGEENNQILQVYREKDRLKTNLPHWEILTKLDGWLPEESGLISGTKHVIFKGKVAQLVRAIEQFMLDEHLKTGFTLIEPPVIVNASALFNSSQLPKFKEDLFALASGQYLIPTAEVSLINLAANKLFKETDLPIKYVALTDCFRKEAGAAGQDNRGIIRLHQFRKVELVMIGKKEEEENDFKTITNAAKNILNKLAIPYREVLLCSQEQSFGATKTIDLEVWMPGMNTYKEISSISSTSDFQTRRMHTRIKTASNEKKLAYAYNASGLAIERTLAVILETYYSKKSNKLIIPKPLVKYLPFASI